MGGKRPAATMTPMDSGETGIISQLLLHHATSMRPRFPFNLKLELILK